MDRNVCSGRLCGQFAGRREQVRLPAAVVEECHEQQQALFRAAQVICVIDKKYWSGSHSARSMIDMN